MSKIWNVEFYNLWILGINDIRWSESVGKREKSI